MQFLIDWASQTWHLVAGSAFWLLIGFAAAGFISVLVPSRMILDHLGGAGMKSVVKASLFGIPLTLCSCSVIPVASSLRRRGASKGATAGFLISTPEIGVDSFALSYALLGPVLAIARPVAALVTTLTAGGLIELFDREPPAKPMLDDAEGGASDDCCDTPAEPEKSIGAAIRYGYVELLSDLAHWLAIGFLLAGLVAVLIPDGFLEEYVGDGLVAKVVMLVVGLPLYICATASTPFAAALIARGLSPGAALVFLLAGPATNAATMTVISKDLGVRSLTIYLASIAAIALLAGVGLDAMVGDIGLPESIFEQQEHGLSTLNGVAGLIFCALLLNGLRVRWSKSARMAGGE